MEQKFPNKSGLSLWQKAMSFDVIQSRYGDQVQNEMDLLATLVNLYHDNKDSPDTLKNELDEFIQYWEECCDCTDGKVLNYKYED